MSMDEPGPFDSGPTRPGAFDQKLREAFEPAYAVERELTGGGMSRVFLATERALNRKVVIKVLPPELAAGVNRERFRREIQLAAQLQHPHIVPLYSAGEHGDLLYYTMPFIEGESLKHAIHEHGAQKPFTLREVIRILHDVSDALAYAHARGVIHRDIKPGNVLRSGSHAVVTDFGVAKAISASLPAVGMTTSGMAIGTPAYMAPEQLAGDPAGDHRIDIYAVGLLAYELLTGVAPFNEPSPQATLAAQMTREPEPVARKRPDVPPALAALVMKCLAKMPEQRPQTAHELVVELDAIPTGSGDFLPSTVPTRRWGVLAGALAVAAIAFVIWRGKPSGTGAPASARDSVPAPRPAAPAAAPAPAPAPALTHAESLAIASAVERRMASRAPASQPVTKIDSATLAAIRADVERLVLDSLQKVRPQEPAPGTPGAPQFGNRGPRSNFTGMTQAQVDSIVRAARGLADFARGGREPTVIPPIPPRGTADRALYDVRAATMGPPRHLVIADPPPDSRHAELQAAGTLVMDALRKRLSAEARYVLVNHDSVVAVLQRTRSRDSVMHLLNADMNVSIRPQMIGGRPDSVRWQITIYDPTSVSRLTTVMAGPVPVSAEPALLDSIARLAARSIWQLDHMPRRGTIAPPAGTPPPDSAPAAAQPPPVKKP